ncbi:hypothetical protein D3C86_1487900 [compost metagenome]
MNGAEAVLVPGLVSTFRTLKSVVFARLRKFSASDSFSKSFLSFAKISCFALFRKIPSSLKLGFGSNPLISFSLSTTNLTATDCTRPAESPVFTFFQRTGDISKPTILSRTRLACWAFTRFWSMSLGLSIAFKIAFLVISWKTILFLFSGFNFNSSAKCQAIASPSRSSSDASQTISAFFTEAFNSATNFFLSADTS